MIGQIPVSLTGAVTLSFYGEIKEWRATSIAQTDREALLYSKLAELDAVKVEAVKLQLEEALSSLRNRINTFTREHGRELHMLTEAIQPKLVDKVSRISVLQDVLHGNRSLLPAAKACREFMRIVTSPKLTVCS